MEDWGEDNEAWGEDNEEWGTEGGAWDEEGDDNNNDNILNSDIIIDGLKNGTGKVENYKCISVSELQDEFNGVIAEFGDMLSLAPPYEEAKLILQYYDWNVDKATDKYFMGNKSLVRVNSGIDGNYVSDTDMDMTEESVDMEDIELECPICMDDIEPDKSSALTCGHRICSSCWSQYILHSAKTSTCFRLKCPMMKCDVAATPERLLQIGVDKKSVNILQERSLKFRSKHFVKNSKHLMECLGQDCTNTIRLMVNKESLIKQQLLDVSCNCGYAFCVGCDMESHNPCLCDVAAAWHEKSSSESENMKWILARTKKCPGCKTPIEKNQGCNHMTCNSCKYEFCWLCKGAWKTHNTSTGGFYKCNVYESKNISKDASEEEKSIAEAKAELERYKFYFSRYENHIRSISFMKKTLEEAEKKIGALMAKYNWKPNEATFIKESADTIVECRRILAWTYPIGYYMDKKYVKSELFHQYQKDLEQYVEKFHELSEQKIAVFADPDKRAEVINFRRVIQKYRTNLITGIKNDINPSCTFNI